MQFLSWSWCVFAIDWVAVNFIDCIVMAISIRFGTSDCDNPKWPPIVLVKWAKVWILESPDSYTCLTLNKRWLHSSGRVCPIIKGKARSLIIFRIWIYSDTPTWMVHMKKNLGESFTRNMMLEKNPNTVKPRVSGHLPPSKKCPDTRQCPNKRGSRKIVVHPCKWYRFRTQTPLWHILKYDW